MNLKLEKIGIVKKADIGFYNEIKELIQNAKIKKYETVL